MWTPLVAVALLTPALQDVRPFAEELDRKVPILMEQHRVPGVALALIREGEVAHWKSWGTRRAGEELPITPQTGFNVGSVTKMLTAWAVMKEVERGRVALHDPVFEHVTRWKLPRSKHDAAGVTIARLLSHTSGIDGDGVSDWKPGDELPPIERSLSGVAGARPTRLRWEPGTRWSYANSGYGLLQLMMLEVTEQDFEDYLAREVLGPLGMTRSSFEPDAALLAASATPHHPRDEETWIVVRRVTAAGSLHSTLEDLARFAVALCELGPHAPRGRGVLAPRTVERMLEAAPSTFGQWGLGIAIEELGPDLRVVGHSGGAWGWGAECWIDPERANGIVVLGNSTNAGEVIGRLKGDWFQWYERALKAAEQSR